ncbi:lymphocyte expansion molecule-like [Polyodon spathula]|uniref:lymphocyte expansion molecule-like n=1 Tax=Polyodon spathula TaxID=7913 RepID=UPI001B7DAF1B|nr:lymphocyte expansion molecule-like [Polyodon spathula]
MAQKSFRGAPFGTQAARFDVSGVYPNKKKIGTYTEVPYCKTATSELVRGRGPGTYNADTGNFSPAAVLLRASGPGWKREQETLRQTQLPHVLYRDVWERKRILKRKLGPASYSMKDFIELREERPASVLGVCESRESRFRSITAVSCTPGPGTYGKGGIPSAVLEERQRQSPGTLGSMDFNPRSEQSLQSSECDPGPGTYKVKDSLQELLNHTVSKRGPYDVFTGPRSSHASTGHYMVLKTTNLSPGQYEIKSFVEDLQSREKRKSGEFSSLLQYPSIPTERAGCSTLSHCPRSACFPGPGWYNTSPAPRPQTTYPAPFLCSSRRTDTKVKNLNPGPGRYNILESDRSRTAMGHRSAFKSETKRYLSNLGRDFYMKERLRALNLLADRRTFLIPPEKPYEMKPSNSTAIA